MVECRRAATSECLFVALRSIASPACIICDIGGVGFVAVVAVVAVVATVAVAVVVAAVPLDSPLNWLPWLPIAPRGSPLILTFVVRIRDARTRFGLPSWVRGAYSCRLWLCVESGLRAFSGVSGVSGVTRGDTSIRANNEPTVRLLESRTKSERAFSYSFLVDYCVVGEGFNDRSPFIPLRPVPALKFPLSQPEYP